MIDRRRHDSELADSLGAESECRTIAYKRLERVRLVCACGHVMSHIGLGGEQITLYKGVEIFPLQTHFKALRGSPKEKAQRGQYLLAVDLGRYRA